MQRRHNLFNLFRRFSKVIPFVGMLVVLANAGNTVKRKGYLFGTLEVLLDLCPVVCVFKAAIEAYTGDLIPAKAEPAAASLQAMTEPA